MTMKTPMTSIALLLAMAGSAAAADSTPVETTTRFYQWAISAGAQPDAMPVRELLSTELFDLLAAQVAHERACVAVTPPDEKPYMLDQSPFFLWPEGAQSWLIHSEERDGERARVEVALRYDELNWIDGAVLIREGERWVLQDLQWEQGGLRERLQDFLSMPCLPDGEGEQ
jgi:hypothetical protein